MKPTVRRVQRKSLFLESATLTRAVIGSRRNQSTERLSIWEPCGKQLDERGRKTVTQYNRYLSFRSSSELEELVPRRWVRVWVELLRFTGARRRWRTVGSLYISGCDNGAIRWRRRTAVQSDGRNHYPGNHSLPLLSYFFIGKMGAVHAQIASND